MSAWIGPLGNLIEFKCPSAVESSSEDPHVYFRPLGGDVAVTRLGDGTRPRVWDVSVSTARPGDVAALDALASGSFGPGPFVFIPPAAESVNLLGKRDSLAMGEPAGAGYMVDAPGNPVTTTEGLAGSSYVTTGSTTPQVGVGDAPVAPGQPVTGKAWVVPLNGATASVQVRFYSAGHTQVGQSATATTTATGGEFLHATITAPDGAAYARLMAAGAIITHPQLTWTDGPRTWSQSKASSNVIVSPLSAAVRRATGRAGEETITDHRLTVTELRA